MIEQGSPEWFAARVGRVTASRVSDVVAKTRTGWGASRANYMAQLIAERLTGAPAKRFTSAEMQWGTETEPEARAAYQFETATLVSAMGFVPHPSIALAGASPDGAIGDSGLLELKCPNTATHINTLLGGAIPHEYICQMQWQMACTGRRWCDFASYDPRMPEHMRLLVQRVQRDDAHISDLERNVVEFLAELEDKLAKLNAKYPLAETA